LAICSSSSIVIPPPTFPVLEHLLSGHLSGHRAIAQPHRARLQAPTQRAVIRLICPSLSSRPGRCPASFPPRQSACPALMYRPFRAHVMVCLPGGFKLKIVARTSRRHRPGLAHAQECATNRIESSSRSQRPTALYGAFQSARDEQTHFFACAVHDLPSFIVAWQRRRCESAQFSRSRNRTRLTAQRATVQCLSVFLRRGADSSVTTSLAVVINSFCDLAVSVQLGKEIFPLPVPVPIHFAFWRNGWETTIQISAGKKSALHLPG